MQADAIRIEPNLVEPGQEDIVLEVLQTAQGGNSSQIENLANEAENSSDSEICTKNRTLETSDRGRDPIPSEVGDDRRKKRKRGEIGGGQPLYQVGKGAPVGALYAIISLVH